MNLAISMVIALSLLSIGLNPENKAEKPIPFGEITVTNHNDFPRTKEIAETDAVFIKDGKYFLSDSIGKEIPSQLTHDGKLIFQMDIPPHSIVKYKIWKGHPADYDTVAYGRFVPERADDFAWENDRSAYRAYGPALQRNGEKAFGYDVWTKSVSYPIINQRYYDNLKGISFHTDHGDGMDVYNVGPTLGCGTAGVIDEDGDIVYSWCFERYEILDCGPLRISFRLYYPNEVRTITLDAGSYFNRTEIQYLGYNDSITVAPGIVIHHPLEPQSKIPLFTQCVNNMTVIGYADPTDRRAPDQGTIFVGTITPGAKSRLQPLASCVGDASGHILAEVKISPRQPFVYYWGAGWSKSTISDIDSWHKIMTNFTYALSTPPTVTVTKY